MQVRQVASPITQFVVARATTTARARRVGRAAMPFAGIRLLPRPSARAREAVAAHQSPPLVCV